MDIDRDSFAYHAFYGSFDNLTNYEKTLFGYMWVQFKEGMGLREDTLPDRMTLIIDHLRVCQHRGCTQKEILRRLYAIRYIYHLRNEPFVHNLDSLQRLLALWLENWFGDQSEMKHPLRAYCVEVERQHRRSLETGRPMPALHSIRA